MHPVKSPFTATVHSAVTVKCISKNTKRKNAINLNKLVRLQKRNNSYFYPDETILSKQQIFSLYDIVIVPMRELSYLNRNHNNIWHDERIR
jgi:hypothetical protein